MTAICSCNLFFSAPHGRENIFDEGAQITAFTAVPSSDKSIVTMWNWKKPPSWLYDDRITEIRIQHSILGYPENLDFIFGESFTNKNDWQHEWKNLIPGITHYFSLFAKVDSNDGDNNDYWLAPIKAKAKLPGKFKSSIFGIKDSLSVSDGGPVFIQSMAGAVPVNDSGPFYCIVIELNLPSDIYIVSATIKTDTFGNGGGIETTSPLRAFPITDIWDQSPDLPEGYFQLNHNTRDDYAVEDTISAFIDSANDTINDVTEVVRRAAVAKNKQIVLKMNTPGNSIVEIYGTQFIDIDYISD